MFGRSLTPAPCETPLRLSFKSKRGGGSERHAGLPQQYSHRSSSPGWRAYGSMEGETQVQADLGSAGDFDGVSVNRCQETLELPMTGVGEMKPLAQAKVSDDA